MSQQSSIVYIVNQRLIGRFRPQRPAGRSPRLTIIVLLSCIAPASLVNAQAPPAGLKIEVLEGEGAINNIRLHRAREPVVRTVNENNDPLSGVSVSFLLPDMGPSGEFAGNIRELTVFTDEKGQATARGLVPNQMLGRFQIRVVASYRGQSASATINQTNAAPGGAISRGPSKKVLLIALIGGAAAGGVALAATHGGGGNSNSQPTGSTNPTGIVITSGTPVFQPPH